MVRTAISDLVLRKRAGVLDEEDKPTNGLNDCPERRHARTKPAVQQSRLFLGSEQVERQRMVACRERGPAISEQIERGLKAGAHVGGEAVYALSECIDESVAARRNRKRMRHQLLSRGAKRGESYG